MSRFIELIRGESVYTEFIEGEIKKIDSHIKYKGKIEIQIDLEGKTIIEIVSVGRNKDSVAYLFPDKHKFLYELICFKENNPIPDRITPIECRLEDLKELEGLKIPCLISHKLTEKEKRETTRYYHFLNGSDEIGKK